MTKIKLMFSPFAIAATMLAAGGLYVMSAPLALAQGVHGIAFAKGCSSPTLIGQAYKCDYTIANSIDSGNGSLNSSDTLTITSLVDNVQANPPVNSGNILPLLTLTLSNGATCNSGQTLCTLPHGASITTTVPYTFYNVKANDPDPLTDMATLTWQDLCNSGATNCSTGNLTTPATSESSLKYAPTVTTAIHNAAHATITAANSGDVVHDSVSVTGSGPTPGGNVILSYFTNGTCDGSASATSTIALVSGKVDATGFAQTVTPAMASFKVHYPGDTNYIAGDSNCEPLTVNPMKPTVTTAIHNTAHNIISAANSGDVVHDSVTVTGNGVITPTGNVTFDYFTNGTCASEPEDTSDPIALNSGSIDDTAFTETVAPSAVSFMAHYAGDTNYAAADSSCEPLTVSLMKPTVTTAIHNAAHATIITANSGDVVHDSVTVTGNGIIVPTGNVTFDYFTNGTCGDDPDATSGTFALASGAVDATTFTQTVAPTMASFMAHYAGDTVYAAADSACEPLTVNSATPPQLTLIKQVVCNNKTTCKDRCKGWDMGCANLAVWMVAGIDSGNSTSTPPMDCGNKPDCKNQGTDMSCADPTAWTLTATDVDATSTPPLSGTTPVVSGPGFMPGTYTLSESDGPDGYAAGDWNCVLNGAAPVAGDTITLASGDVAICTIINTKTPPEKKSNIKVIKYAIGGTDTFNFTLDNATSTLSITPTVMGKGKIAMGSDMFTNVTPGMHQIDETLPSGWKQVKNTCDHVKVRAGRTVTCMIVNEKIKKPCDPKKPGWDKSGCDQKVTCGCDNRDKNDKNCGKDEGMFGGRLMPIARGYK